MVVQLANKAMGDAYCVPVEKLLHSNVQSVQTGLDTLQEKQMLKEGEKDRVLSDEVHKAGEELATDGEKVWQGDQLRMLGLEQEVIETDESK